jgi:hypothetical protein
MPCTVITVCVSNERCVAPRCSRDVFACPWCVCVLCVCRVSCVVCRVCVVVVCLCSWSSGGLGPYFNVTSSELLLADN